MYIPYDRKLISLYIQKQEDGLGEPSELSSCVDCEIGLIDDFRIIDARVLPEFDTLSSASEYKLNVVRVTSYLELGEKVDRLT